MASMRQQITEDSDSFGRQVQSMDSDLTLRPLGHRWGFRSQQPTASSHWSLVVAAVQGAVPPYTVLIVDGTLVPTCDHKIAEQSKNYRYHDHRRRRRLPGNRTDSHEPVFAVGPMGVGRTGTMNLLD